MRSRGLVGPALGLIAALTLAGTALAGGSATVTLIGDEPQPVAGEPVEVEFVMLQHGVTPVSWPDAFVTATHVTSGEVVRTAAEPYGAEGRYVATLTLPREGAWDWAVETDDLEITNDLSPTTVAAAAAQPTGDAWVALIAALTVGAAGVLALLMLRSRRTRRSGRSQPAESGRAIAA